MGYILMIEGIGMQVYFSESGLTNEVDGLINPTLDVPETTMHL